jgi:hypothetical protein
MTNYQNGKIYKIECVNGEKDDMYIGSTAKQYLSQRMEKHRSSYKGWKEGKTNKTTSFNLFDKYGVENCIIVLIENFPCNTRDELKSREAFYIKSMSCVNRCIPLQTSREWYALNRERILEYAKEYGKEYYQENKEDRLKYKNAYYYSNQDKIRESSKTYYTEHKDKIADDNSKYYQDNKVKINERNKAYQEKNVESMTAYKAQWYQDNKLKIDKKNQEKITCACGSTCYRNGISEHKNSKKHRKYEESL